MVLAEVATGAPGFEALESAQAGGEVLAIGPTDQEGVFVTYTKGTGFQYLEWKGKASWSAGASFACSFAAELRLLFFRRAADAAHVSFVEASSQSWTCVSLPVPDASTGKAVLVERTALPASVVDAAAAPGDTVAAVALSSSTVRFMDMTTGKAAGKGLKLDASGGVAAPVLRLARLGAGRAAVVRAADKGAEFFVVQFDAEAQRTALQLRGMLRLAEWPLAGALRGVAAAAGPGEDRVLLCWGSDAAEPVYTTAVLDSEEPQLLQLAKRGNGTDGAAAKAAPLWHCVDGYLAEWCRSSGGALKCTLRDLRFGMVAGSGELQLSEGTLTVSTFGGFTMLLSGSAVRAVRWSLPPFSLQVVVGRSSTALPQEVPESLAPVREAVLGKRRRDDADLQQMFSAKRHATSDAAMASEVRKRHWHPSHELVDVIVRHKCWAAGRALLALPELSDDLAVRLLAEHMEFLARVVRRARASVTLDIALRDHLPAAMLPRILEVLFSWIEVYRDIPEANLREAVPGLPALLDIVAFLSALADGCVLSLVRLEGDLIERMLDQLAFARAETNRTERLYTAVRAACRINKPMKAVGDTPVVEAMLVDF